MKQAVILAVVPVAIASLLLERIGVSRDISAAIFLCVAFAFLHFRVRKRDLPFDMTDALLIAPIVMVCLLVVLKEAGAIAISSTVIWVGFGLLCIVAFGFAAPSDDGTDTAP